MNARRVDPTELVAVAAALVPFALFVLRFDFLADDAFIAFRYARNLAEGHGLTYNLDGRRPVEGYTELGWVLLLAGAHRVGLSMLVVSRVVSALCGAALVALVTVHCRRRLGLGAAGTLCVGLYAATLPPMVVWSTGGLATMPVALALFVAWERWLGDPERPHGLAAGVAAALATVLRADGIGFVLLVGCAAAVRAARTRDDRLWRASRWAVGIPLSVASAQMAFRLGYHGDFVPNTARVKAGFAVLRLERGILYVVSQCLALPSLVLPLVVRRRRGADGSPLWMVGGTAAYAVYLGGDFMAMARLFVPAMPFLAVLFAGAWARLAERGARTAALGYAAASVALSLLPSFDVNPVPRALRERYSFRWGTEYVTEWRRWRGMDANVRSWSVEARALSLVVRPGDSLIDGTLGVVGWYNPRLVVYDVHGLTDREGARAAGPPQRLWPGHDRPVPLDVYFRRRPTYLGYFIAPRDAPLERGVPPEWAAPPLRRRYDIERHALPASFGRDVEMRLLRLRWRDRPRLVVIGLDAATLEVAGPLLDRGELPNLARIRDRGVHGVLRSFVPTFSPILWTSMVTGVGMERHGIRGFVMRMPGRNRSSLIPITERRVPALWDLAGRAGMKVGVVGWWVTWPAPAVNGFAVSNTVLMTGERDRSTHPPSLATRLDGIVARGLDPAAELAAMVEGPVDLPCPGRIPSPSGVRPRFLEDLCELIQRDAAAGEIARALHEEVGPDVLFAYMNGIDGAQHGYWKFAFPGDAEWRLRPSEADVRRFGGAIAGMYRLADRLVGRIVEVDPDATVVVLSDHGFGPAADCGTPVFRYDKLLQGLGLLAVRPGGGIDWSRTVVAHDEMQGRERRRADNLDPGGLFYLNLRERSPDGIVPASRYRREAARIAALLRSVVTADGAALFASVRVNESPPADGQEPDIEVALRPGLRGDDEIRVGGRSERASSYLVEVDNSGRHFDGTQQQLSGMYFAAGRGIARRAAPGRAGVLDVGPTLACLLGLRFTVRPDGEPSPAILSRETLDGCPAWGPSADEPDAGGAPPEPFPADERLRDQLRGLGYVQ